MTQSKLHGRIMLRACPRCRGDLFPELEEKDLFACLQCGRRIAAEQISAPEPALVPAA
jgi:DNA-directed RNA polymerase subunit RPC12/RpoP